ncbi:MAG TPA: response regulator transcription factor [Candidatus Saccharimonadales bacterium]|nr:response regulator transcription factor [Candidatus Saccharimonadales bacterium]
MRLLIIEDNLALAWRLQASLENDFEVHMARTGASGQRQAETGRFDLIILDLGLPDMSGAEVCNGLRAAGILTPVLILTGEDTVQTKVHLFSVGADDYVTKPFDLEELRARITALLRRRQVGAPPQLLQVGKLQINPAQRTVKYEGTAIHLRRKEFDILEYLARNQGKVVTQAMIFNHVWGDFDKDVWNNTVRVHVKHLRDKIDRPFNASLLKTARGVGYVLRAP